MICPACRSENIDGVDQCESCHAPLTDAENLEHPREGWETRIVKDPIRKVGTRDPIVVGRTTSVRDVLRKMKSKQVGCALVAERNEVIGIFTERDILRKISQPGIDLADMEMANAMTPGPEVLKDTDTVAFALNKMAMGNFRHVPVRKEDGSLCVVSVRDILRYVF